MNGEVSYDKVADDLVDLYRDLFWANLRRKPLRRLTIVATSSLALALGGYALDSVEDGLGYILYGAAIGLVVGIPVCWGVSYALLSRRARALSTQQRTQDATWTWRWTEKSLEAASANGQSRYHWTELHRWHDGRRTLMFFLNDAHVLYIPRRVLDGEQASALGALATRAGVQRF